MVMHTQLPIHKTGSDLLGVATLILVKMNRDYKRAVGEKIVGNCSDMLNLMALANATRGRQRAEHLRGILAHQRAATMWLRVALDLKAVAPSHWSKAIQMLESVSKQATGWLAKTTEPAPAA